MGGYEAQRGADPRGRATYPDALSQDQVESRGRSGTALGVCVRSSSCVYSGDLGGKVGDACLNAQILGRNGRRVIRDREPGFSDELAAAGWITAGRTRNPAQKNVCSRGVGSDNDEGCCCRGAEAIVVDPDCSVGRWHAADQRDGDSSNGDIVQIERKLRARATRTTRATHATLLGAALC